ncbi:TonB-dependent receptor [Acidovorax sp. CCYZU-2555]|nr:TonB-dependent receptor [Acidovorax sp. CCYZU-2555]
MRLPALGDAAPQARRRGIGSTYGANYRDGLKEVGSAYAVPRVNSYGVERVEFLRGPASLLVGSNAPGGVVNAITKRPTQDAQRAIRLRAGDSDRHGIAADVSGPLNEEGTVLYRLVAQTEHYDLPTPQTDKDQSYFAPSLTLRLGRDTELTLLADVQRERIHGDAYPYSYDEAFGRYIGVVEKGRDRFYRDQWSGGFLPAHRFSDSLGFQSRTRYTDTKLDYRRSFPNSIPNGTLVGRGAQDMQDAGKAWQSDNFLERKWSVGQWAHTTIAGIDLSHVDAALYRGVGTTSPYDLATGQGAGAYIAPPLVPYQRAKSRQAGLYGQNQAKFDDRFVIVAGLRRDRYRETVTASWRQVAGGLRKTARHPSRSPRPSLQRGLGVASELVFGDGVAVHFVRAVGHAQMAGVGPEADQQRVLAQSHGAEGLHRVVDDPDAVVGGNHFDHRDLRRCDLVADRVHAPGGVQHHPPGLLDQHPRLRDAFAPYALVGQRLAEGDARQGTLAHHLQRRLGHAYHSHAVVYAPRTEPALGNLETPPFAQQYAVHGHAHVLEQNFGVAEWRVIVIDQRHVADHRDAWGIGWHDDHGLLAVAIGVVRVGFSHQDE